MVVERIGPDTPRSSRDGHETRYHLAAGFVLPGDTVVDAACGTGYGADILLARGGASYVGVDREPTLRRDDDGATFIVADLTGWEPDFEYEVFVGFETVEHLAEYGHYLDVARSALRTVVLSVPVVPTVGANPWHLHDFRPGQLADEFLRVTGDWRLVQTLGQPAELAEIYVFSRST